MNEWICRQSIYHLYFVQPKQEVDQNHVTVGVWLWKDDPWHCARLRVCVKAGGWGGIWAFFPLSVHEPCGQKSYSGLPSWVSHTHRQRSNYYSRFSPRTFRPLVINCPWARVCSHLSVRVSTSLCRSINLYQLSVEKLNVIDLSFMLAWGGQRGGQVLLMLNSQRHKTQSVWKSNI